jgi:metal-responsive CopG/Arc/MetJ family transcriptional regulator
LAKKGEKSTRGKPEIYSEVKKSICICLTPTAIANLDKLAQARQISRSEFVEQLTRSLPDLDLKKKEKKGLLL